MIRNASDEYAVEVLNARFDQERATHVCEFFERELILYEGEYAGTYFRLMPWQRDCLSRIFGWVFYSKDWGREIRRFRKANIWVPKKNGKSPMAAGVGLYLLARDGESGQKVFSIAKDGKQAKIVHTHAMRMVEKSPTLASECTVNKSTCRIEHHESDSFYDLLSGDNIRGQEGLNGCSICDEKHVVDDRLAKVLEYMGASRSEPLDLGVSTFGNDPDSWGKKEYDYGAAVERGAIKDAHFFHEAWEFPAKGTDDEIDDPEMWKKCNPSWGITIKESEMRQACERSKRTKADRNSFKMYRLNFWLNSANPWLEIDDWEKCKDDRTLESFEGSPCWVALDLSKTRDMSCVMLVFRVDREGNPESQDDGEEIDFEKHADFYQFPFFWLPEEYAQKHADMPFMDWGDDGYIELVDGPVIRQSYIKRKLKWIDEHFSVMNFSYDRKYASDLVDDFCEGELGWECIEFGQSMSSMTGPTTDYESLVVDGKLHHDGNPVLSWQAGHVSIKTNENQDKRPVKPGRDDVKKIDGIVAGIMATYAAITTEFYQPGSLYEGDGYMA